MTNLYKKDYFLNRKLKWEKNHGNFIHEFMFNEYQARILGQCNIALNDLQRQLDLEIARAKAEEKRLDQKIDAETARATAEETRLDGKIDAETTRATGEETRLDGKIDAEITRATGRENELSTSINACLPKAGGTMEDHTYINWSHESQNPNVDPFPLGGLFWEGATDIIAIQGEITAHDNMNLAVNLGDDNSNSVSFRDKDGVERSAITATGHFTGTIDWSHINNRPEIDKQTIDTLKQTCADLQARVAELEKGKA